ncbi:hypothetical protein BH09ACT10_BH09ACT10_09830 [soil metagenome]
MVDFSLIALASMLAAMAASYGPALLRALPEPDDAEPGKPTYAKLARTSRLAISLAVGAALITAAVGWRIGAEPILTAWAVLSVVGVLLAFIDWRTRLLPYRVVVPSTVVVGLLLVEAAVIDGAWDALLRSTLAGLAVFAAFFVSWWVLPRAVGYGDVRISGMLGAMLGWHGWSTVFVGMYAAFLLGAVIGVGLAVAKVVDRKAIPFGPFLFAGTFLGVLIAP